MYKQLSFSFFHCLRCLSFFLSFYISDNIMYHVITLVIHVIIHKYVVTYVHVTVSTKSNCLDVKYYTRMSNDECMYITRCIQWFLQCCHDNQTLVYSLLHIYLLGPNLVGKVLVSKYPMVTTKTVKK